MGSAHKIKLRVLIIEMVLIGMIALLCSTNGWSDYESEQDFKKEFGFIPETKQEKYERLKRQARKQQEAVKLGAKRHKEILKEIKEKAPERCVCSDTAIGEIGGYLETEVDILHCKCGKALCIVNLQGAYFAPSQDCLNSIQHTMYTK